MTDGWDALTAAELRAVASALVAGRINERPGELALQSLCTRENATWLARTLSAMGGEPKSLAALLNAFAAERERVAQAQRGIELVWSGPEIPNDTARDTGAAVRELFVSAREHVLIVGYAIHGGLDLFKLLADRYDAEPSLAIDMVVDIRRERNDTSLASEIVARFTRDFRSRQWPGRRLPSVHHHPASLADERTQRFAMHAKCIVVDRAAALVTSANFTHAAQKRNVEVGMLVRDPAISSGIAGRFDYLIQSGSLRALQFDTLG